MKNISRLKPGVWRVLACLTLSHVFIGGALAQAPDISGVWMPLASLSNTWEVDDLPLNDAALAKIESFDKKQHDSTAFCMPFGTPRNTLNTAPAPLEIIQSDRQVTFIFDGLGDVRRIFTDDRSFPEDPIPSWLGYSVGAWEGDALLVETIAMTEESILSDDGLPHSASMRVEERFELVERDGQMLLKDDITVHDSEFYSEPLTATRYFVRSPYSVMSEGSALCLLNQWRTTLEDMNREQYRETLRRETQESN